MSFRTTFSQKFRILCWNIDKVNLRVKTLTLLFSAVMSTFVSSFMSSFLLKYSLSTFVSTFLATLLATFLATVLWTVLATFSSTFLATFWSTFLATFWWLFWWLFLKSFCRDLCSRAQDTTLLIAMVSSSSKFFGFSGFFWAVKGLRCFHEKTGDTAESPYSHALDENSFR